MTALVTSSAILVFCCSDFPDHILTITWGIDLSSVEARMRSVRSEAATRGEGVADDEAGVGEACGRALEQPRPKADSEAVIGCSNHPESPQRPKSQLLLLEQFRAVRDRSV